MSNSNIFLVGFMGCGKTTIARKLARALNYDHLDLDLAIEQRLQQKIEDIFQHNGEHYFRLQEQHQLHRCNELQHTVIAVGGGTPCFFDNMDWMLENGKVVYIEMSAKALYNRLKNAKRPRPLIDSLKDQELLDFIEKKLAEREKFYNKAHTIINGLHINIQSLSIDLEQL